MKKKSSSDRNIQDRIRILIRNLRLRYCRRNNFYIGLLALKAGQKLLKGYYRKHQDEFALIEWRKLIIDDMTEFQEDLLKYKIKEKE